MIKPATPLPWIENGLERKGEKHVCLFSLDEMSKVEGPYRAVLSISDFESYDEIDKGNLEYIKTASNEFHALVREVHMQYKKDEMMLKTMQDRINLDRKKDLLTRCGVKL